MKMYLAPKFKEIRKLDENEMTEKWDSPLMTRQKY
jgi:hypothetical protein